MEMTRRGTGTAQQRVIIDITGIDVVSITGQPKTNTKDTKLMPSAESAELSYGVGSGFQGDFHHLMEGGLDLFRGQMFRLEEVVGNCEEGQCLLVSVHRLRIKAGAFHLYGQKTCFLFLLGNGRIGIVEEIGGIDASDRGGYCSCATKAAKILQSLCRSITGCLKFYP
jgi:hypothetical protein